MGICDDLKKKGDDFRQQQRELNKERLARAFGLESGQYTPETIVDHLVNNMGLDRATLEATMANPKTTEDGLQAHSDAAERLNSKAVEMAKDFESGDLKQKLEASAKSVREKVREGVVRTLSTVPHGISDKVRGFIRFVSGESQMLPSGKDKNGNTVLSGRAEAKAFQATVKDFYQKNKAALGVGWKAFDTSMQLIGGGRRGKDFEGSMDDYKARIQARMEAKPALKDFASQLDVAKSLYDKPLVREFLKQHEDRLDAYKEDGKKYGIFNPMDGYWHNTVVLEGYADWYEKLGGTPINTSDFRESKKYPSLIDMIIDSPVMPASLSFTELGGRYISNLGRALTLAKVKEQLIDQLNLSSNHPDKMTIQTPDGAYPIVGMRTAEGRFPELPSGETYKNLGPVNQAWDGIYIHPDFYPWMNSNFGSMGKLNPTLRMAINTGQLMKNMTVGMGLGSFSPHGMSLLHKYYSVGASNGILKFETPWDASAAGKSRLINHDASAMELIQHGLTTGQPDMIQNPLFRQQNLLSATEGKAFEVLNKIGITPEEMAHPVSDLISKYNNWQHDKLFGFQLGLKLEIGSRLTQTKWFEAMAEKHGRDYAVDHVAKLMNDKFGGQNMEAIGRSKGVQLAMRAALLAPDWLESKLNSLGKIGLSNDMKKVYAASFITHMGMLAVAHTILQSVYDEVTGHKSDVWKDWMNGDLGVLSLGKTKDGKHDIVSRIDFAGTEDWRLIAHTYSGLMQSVKKGSVTPLAGTLATEASYKLSPMARLPLEEIQAKKDLDKYGKKKPSAFDYPGLPIPVQQAIYDARGGYGSTPEEKQRAIWEILLAIPAGGSVESRNAKKEDKKMGMRK